MSTPQMQALAGLRGVAALMVVGYHTKFVLQAQIPVSAWTGVLDNSYLFVELFFLLSGYTLARIHGERFRYPVGAGNYLRFQRRRLSRIYPLHLILTLAMVAGVLILEIPFEKKYSLPALASNLALVQAWGVHDRLTWNLPAWALSALFASYLLFPFINRALGAAGEGVKALAAALCLGVLVVLERVAGSLDITYDWGAVLCLSEFTLGMLLHHAGAMQTLGRRLSSTPAQLLVAGALGLCLHLGGYDVLVTVLLATLILSLSDDRGLLARAFGARWARWLGTYSFAIYLVHYPLGRLFKGRELPLESLFGADTWMGALSHFCEAMLAFIIAAWLLTRLVAEPLRRALRRR